jgi:hypothetical protein
MTRKDKKELKKIQKRIRELKRYIEEKEKLLRLRQKLIDESMDEIYLAKRRCRSGKEEHSESDGCAQQMGKQ